ncbi:MAG: HAD family hydrolase [Rhodoglobus sp.]
MSYKPVTIFFDVNETLSNLDTVADAFVSIGACPELAASWFASILRDGFALTSTGSDAGFLAIAKTNARGTLSEVALTSSLDDSVDAVIAAFTSVRLHPDVSEGFRSLHAAGHELFTLSNGPASNAERMLTAAGVADTISGFLSVEGHSPWKPARAAYESARIRTGTQRPAYLVAVHPWDIHGAALAGLSTVWVNRTGAHYPEHFTPPTVIVRTIAELSDQLARGETCRADGT